MTISTAFSVSLSFTTSSTFGLAAPGLMNDPLLHSPARDRSDVQAQEAGVGQGILDCGQPLGPHYRLNLVHRLPLPLL